MQAPMLLEGPIFFISPTSGDDKYECLYEKDCSQSETQISAGNIIGRARYITIVAPRIRRCVLVLDPRLHQANRFDQKGRPRRQRGRTAYIQSKLVLSLADRHRLVSKQDGHAYLRIKRRPAYDRRP